MNMAYNTSILKNSFGILQKDNAYVAIQYLGSHGWYLLFLQSHLQGKENHKPKIAWEDEMNKLSLFCFFGFCLFAIVFFSLFAVCFLFITDTFGGNFWKGKE